MFRTIIALYILSVSFSSVAMHTTPVTKTSHEILRYAAEGKCLAIESYLQEKHYALPEYEKKEISDWAYRGGHFSIVERISKTPMAQDFYWPEEDIYPVIELKRILFRGIQEGSLVDIEDARECLHNFFRENYKGDFDINNIINGDGLTPWQVAENKDFLKLADSLKEKMPSKLTEAKRKEINDDITRARIAFIYKAPELGKIDITIHDFPWSIFVKIREIEEKKRQEGEISALKDTYLSHVIARSEKFDEQTWKLVNRSALFLKKTKYDLPSKGATLAVNNITNKKHFKENNRLLKNERKGEEAYPEFTAALENKNVEKIYLSVSRNKENIEDLSYIAATHGQIELSIFLSDIYLWDIVNTLRMQKMVEERGSLVNKFLRIFY